MAHGPIERVLLGVQLEPLGSERPEAPLLVVPEAHSLVHHARRDANKAAGEVVRARPSAAVVDLAHERTGLAEGGDGQEAVDPAVPGRLDIAMRGAMVVEWLAPQVQALVAAVDSLLARALAPRHPQILPLGCHRVPA